MAGSVLALLPIPSGKEFRKILDQSAQKVFIEGIPKERKTSTDQSVLPRNKT